ncbi:AzlD domain-containing protein [Alphaproteobacteria bacterium]|nr:AzlD domain-containing protein [Alphaproteobacteria bacterium]
MIWLVMIATGLFTFATRFIMLSNIIGNRPPPWLVDALGFVPIAVLTAIIAPAILLDPANQTIALWDNPRLFAAILAIIAALITRQMITTIVVGLVALWILQWAM